MALAALVGMGMGLLHGALTVPLGLSQHVSGLGITLLSTSVAYYTYRVLLPGVTTPPRIEPFPPLAGAWLADLPVVGPVLAQQTALLSRVGLGARLGVPPLGLAIRAVGETLPRSRRRE